MLNITACLDHSGPAPAVSTPPNLAGRAPSDYLTGFFGTRDHNALVREAMAACRERGWPFHRADIGVERLGSGPDRQGWDDFSGRGGKERSNVLNLFTAKREVEKDLAALLGAAGLKTAGMLDRQTLRKLAADPDWAVGRIFGDGRLAGVDVLVWGVEDAGNPGAGRYRRVATLRTVAGLSAEDVAVYDYDCEASGWPGFKAGLC